MNKDIDEISEWQAGAMNESAHKYLSLFCVSWIFFMFVIATQYGYFLVSSLIAMCFAIYYWFERTKMGAHYLREAFIEREAAFQLIQRAEAKK